VSCWNWIFAGHILFPSLANEHCQSTVGFYISFMNNEMRSGPIIVVDELVFCSIQY